MQSRLASSSSRYATQVVVSSRVNRCVCACVQVGLRARAHARMCVCLVRACVRAHMPVVCVWSWWGTARDIGTSGPGCSLGPKGAPGWGHQRLCFFSKPSVRPHEHGPHGPLAPIALALRLCHPLPPPPTPPYPVLLHICRMGARQ